MAHVEIDRTKQYVIVCPDKKKALELQKFWLSFLAGGVQAIFLYGNVAVMPVEQVAGWTTWEQAGIEIPRNTQENGRNRPC